MIEMGAAVGIVADVVDAVRWKVTGVVWRSAKTHGSKNAHVVVYIMEVELLTGESRSPSRQSDEVLTSCPVVWIVHLLVFRRGKTAEVT